MLSEDDDLAPISALQHLAFCDRQCALIHIEGVWAENELTAEGRIAHGRADLPGLSGRGRVARSIQLRSSRLGVAGRADVVEFLPPAVLGGKPVPFPIEYKRGRQADRLADRVQLCAQAYALEEMTETEVPRGALFYHASRRRIEVEFDEALRSKTEVLARELREMFETVRIPHAVLQPKCQRCSLKSICQPAPPGQAGAAKYLNGVLEDAGGPER